MCVILNACKENLIEHVEDCVGLGSVLFRMAVWDREDAMAYFIGLFEVSQKTGSKFAPTMHLDPPIQYIA